MGEIREIKRLSLLNVPGRLRELADQIEKNQFKTAILVVGHDNGQVSVFGFGERTDALQTTGWLHRALDAMTSDSHADTTAGSGSWPKGPGPAA